MDTWINRACVSGLLFTGMLMAHCNLLSALSVAAAAVPISILSGTWPAVSGLSVFVFLTALGAMLNGVRLLP
jgi:hypothetical protein